MPSSTLLSRDSDAHQLPEEGLHGLHRAAARGDLARLRQHWWLKKLRKNRLDQAKRCGAGGHLKGLGWDRSPVVRELFPLSWQRGKIQLCLELLGRLERCSKGVPPTATALSSPCGVV